MSLRPFLAMYLAIDYCGVRMGWQGQGTSHLSLKRIGAVSDPTVRMRHPNLASVASYTSIMLSICSFLIAFLSTCF